MNDSEKISKIRKLLNSKPWVKNIIIDCQKLSECYMTTASFDANGLNCQLLAGSFESLSDSLDKMELRVNSFIKC